MANSVSALFSKVFSVQNEIGNFPQGIWTTVQSVDNLSPRGLLNPLTSNDKQVDDQSIEGLRSGRKKDGQSARTNESKGDKRVAGSDNLTLSDRRSASDHLSASSPSQYKYLLFVWNGKNASSQVKSQALSKGYALDDYLKVVKD